MAHAGVRSLRRNTAVALGNSGSAAAADALAEPAAGSRGPTRSWRRMRRGRASGLQPAANLQTAVAARFRTAVAGRAPRIELVWCAAPRRCGPVAPGAPAAPPARPPAGGNGGGARPAAGRPRPPPARRTPGSLLCRQSRKRQSAASASTSSNACSSAWPESQSCSSRIPGVSMITPPAGPQQQLAVHGRVPPAARAAVHAARLLAIAAQQLIDDRGLADARRSEQRHGAARRQVCLQLAETLRTLATGGVQRHSRRDRPDGVHGLGSRRGGAQVGLVEHHHGRGAALGRRHQVALHAARTEVAVEPGHEQHGVDVGRHHLPLRRDRRPPCARSSSAAAGWRGWTRAALPVLMATQSPTAGSPSGPPAAWRSLPAASASSSPVSVRTR